MAHTIHIDRYNAIRNQLQSPRTTVLDAKRIGLALLNFIEIEYGNVDELIINILRSRPGSGAKIEAIKTHRNVVGCGLKESKDYVEALIWKMENGKISKQIGKKEAPRNEAKRKAKKVRLRHRPAPKAKKRKVVA